MEYYDPRIVQGHTRNLDNLMWCQVHGDFFKDEEYRVRFREAIGLAKNGVLFLERDYEIICKTLDEHMHGITTIDSDVLTCLGQRIVKIVSTIREANSLIHLAQTTINLWNTEKP